MLMLGRSSHERRSSIFQNSTTRSSTTSTLNVSLGEGSSVNSTVEDTVVQSTASSLVISMWWRVAIRISFDR
jgi:hypothetical protein